MHKVNDRPEGVAVTQVLVGLVLLTVLSLTVYFLFCPCRQLPGMFLLGDAVVDPVADWSFANSVPLCQVQVKPGTLPHAVNLNCMSAGGALYLSCMNCSDKVWSNAALASSDARLRVGEQVYPVHLARVLEPEQLDVAWQARAEKVGRRPAGPRPEHWWSFAATSR